MKRDLTPLDIQAMKDAIARHRALKTPINYDLISFTAKDGTQRHKVYRGSYAPRNGPRAISDTRVGERIELLARIMPNGYMLDHLENYQPTMRWISNATSTENPT